MSEQEYRDKYEAAQREIKELQEEQAKTKTEQK